MRRTAPLWVRDLDDRALHGLYGRFQRDYPTGGVTEAQGWLWDRVADELAWRRAHPSRGWLRCSCSMCFNPDLERIAE